MLHASIAKESLFCIDVFDEVLKRMNSTCAPSDAMVVKEKRKTTKKTTKDKKKRRSSPVD